MSDIPTRSKCGLFYFLSMEHTLFARALRYITCNYLFCNRQEYIISPITSFFSRN